MKTYKTEDGEAISAASPAELVEKLRDSSRFASEQSIEEYMAGFAERFNEYYGKALPYTSADDFVSNLVEAGYLTIV